MRDNQGYFTKINNAKKQIDDLPASEMKYYLLLLVGSIQSQKTKKNQAFLKHLLALIALLHQLPLTSSENLLKGINTEYQKLQKIAETHTPIAQITNRLLNLFGLVLSLITGIIGLIIGAIAGFIRGIGELQPLNGLYVGLVAGLTLGLAFGYRTPKKLSKDAFQRQLKFGLEGLKECIDTLPNQPTSKTLDAYREEVSREINALFATEEAFDFFLTSPCTYSVNGIMASFIGDPLLEGYMGIHSYIRVDISNKTHLIELGNTPSDLAKPVRQQECRQVPGRLILEMMAYHRKLQERHAITNEYILTKLKPGDNDCFTYLNKILIGTNQEVVTIDRFHDMEPAGAFSGMLIESLSPFHPGFFKEAQKPRVSESATPTQSPNQRIN
ncbi:MAG: hypothetical protein ACHP6H_04325 [Legionellales bacterium]